MKRDKIRRQMLLLFSIIAVGGLLVVLAACNSASSGTTSMNNVPMSNDTVVIGDLNRYVATGEKAEAETGPAMDIDEEAQLQQEKTTGGAGGTVTSTNIVPLGPGITDYSDGDSTTGFVGMTGLPPIVSHGAGNGLECLTCHESGAGGAVLLPKSHKANKVTNAVCGSCHTGL